MRATAPPLKEATMFGHSSSKRSGALKHGLSALVVFCFLFVGGTQSASADPVKQAGHFGLGLGVGTTAAPVSMKYFMSSELSIQANAGWWRSWWGGYGCRNVRDRDRDLYCGGGYYRNAFGIGADLLFEGGRLAGNDDVNLSWEIGGGIGLGVGRNQLGLAGAFVTGLQVNIDAIPLDIVLEYRPSVFFVPGFALNLIDFTGHIRYYF